MFLIQRIYIYIYIYINQVESGAASGRYDSLAVGTPIHRYEAKELSGDNMSVDFVVHDNENNVISMRIMKIARTIWRGC